MDAHPDVADPFTKVTFPLVSGRWKGTSMKRLHHTSNEGYGGRNPRDNVGVCRNLIEATDFQFCCCYFFCSHLQYVERTFIGYQMSSEACGKRTVEKPRSSWTRAEFKLLGLTHPLRETKPPENEKWNQSNWYSLLWTWMFECHIAYTCTESAKRNEKHHVIICLYFVFSINVGTLLLIFFFSNVNYMLIYCVDSLVHLFHCMPTEV